MESIHTDTLLTFLSKVSNLVRVELKLIHQNMNIKKQILIEMERKENIEWAMEEKGERERERERKRDNLPNGAMHPILHQQQL